MSTAADRIFVSIASYCDPLLAFTIESALTQAARPARVFFGVVDQTLLADSLTMASAAMRQRVRYVHIDALAARGPCWARALAMSLWAGEDWYLQIDSHTWFEPGWDERLIAWARRCGSANRRTILSCYPNGFRIDDDEPVSEAVTNGVLAHVVRDDCDFNPEHPVLMFEGVAVESDQALPAIHVAGGCLFAPGTIVEELPYDPFLYFHGEEQAFALRAFTHGWDLMHIPGMPMLHQYVPAKGASRPLHWSAELDALRAIRSAELDRAAQQRLRALLWDGADLGVYGLGQQRSLADYAAFSGIDYAARTVALRARKSHFGY
jgi:hypothetical protein